MEKNNEIKVEQEAVEGIVLAHELTEQGTRLIIICPEMNMIPKNVKILW